ncbi:TPA: hypothetical protein ACH3X2_008359 [Trebouxia sp. C0005]
MNGSAAQLSLWNILPQDVIESILRKLSIRDSWACRNISSCWASAVRSAIEFECLIHVQPRQLRSKLQALQQASRRCSQQAQPVFDRSYTLQLSKSMDVVSCAELLTSLMTKSLSFPNCTVKIPLRPPELKASSYGVRSGVFQRVDEIAYAVSQLRANGVIIYICIQAAGSTDLPALDVMESVASVIHEVDYAQPASMTSTSWRPKRYERFSEDHLWALESARKQMQVLCISDALTPHQFRGEYIGLVASFRQLKKLVLQTKSASPDLSPLTQLTCLEDVSLRVLGHGNCAELIHNQRHKLVHIRLAATSWAKATYQALSKVIALQTLAVNVLRLTPSSAYAIASLQRPHSIHVVLRKCSDPQRRILQILSSGSKVTDLTLKDCTSSMLEGLSTMHSLVSLCIASSNVNDTNLQFQPGVRHLTLLSRGQIDDACIFRMLAVLPALERLSFRFKGASAHSHQIGQTLLSKQSLLAITQAHQLSFLDLEAVPDLSRSSISILEKAFRAQQEVGLASPRILVILPPDARYADPTEKGRQHFFIDYTKRPVFCDRMSAERKPTVTAAQQFLRKVGKPVQSWVRQRAPARTGACKPFVPQDSMGYIVVAGVLAIHTFCITHLLQ